MVIVFIYVIEGNLQWKSWIFKMIDYLKDSIVKFKLNFAKALEKNANQYDDDKYKVKHVLNNFDLFSKNDHGYFVAYFD